MRDDNTVHIRSGGDWDRLVQATGHEPVVNGLVSQIVTVGSNGRNRDEAATDFALGFLDALPPEDAAETLPLSQMAVTHQLMMATAGRLNRAKTIPQ